MSEISLLDLAGRDYVDWYVLYTPRTQQYWWNWFLKSEFEHVQLWRPVYFGPRLSDRFWLVVDPGLEHVDTYIDANPVAPWDRGMAMIVQYVRAVVKLKRLREFFFLGPITCVEMAKAHLGIRSWFLRTPHQLYKHIQKNNNRVIAKS